MKTSKQLSEEILEKISKREAVRLRVRKRMRRVFAGVIMLCFLVPATVFFSMTEELNQYRPLSHPFEPKESEPFDPDEPPSENPQMWKNDDGYQISLML